MKKVLIVIGIVILVLAIAAGSLYAIYVRPLMAFFNQTKEVQVDKDLTLVIGGGGNSGIFNSDNLVIIVDPKMGEEIQKAFYEKVKAIAGNKPVLVVNTHIHGDHSSGNHLYKGQQIIAGGNYTQEQWIDEAKEENLPTIWLKKDTTIITSNDTISIFGLNRNIHTASDVFVYSRKHKLLFGGDVILDKQNPAIMGVADPDGYLYAFDELPKRYEIKTIVPGHGEVGGIEVLETFRQYFLDMKEAISNPSKKDELVAKYKDWRNLPFMMSPDATISALKKKENK